MPTAARGTCLTGALMQRWNETARRARRTARPVVLAAVLALTALIALPVAASLHDVGSPRTRGHGSGRDGRSTLAPTNVFVSIKPQARARPVPSTYIGLSFELSTLGEVALLGERGNLVTLLRSLGPGVLRFGGVTA